MKIKIEPFLTPICAYTKEDYKTYDLRITTDYNELLIYEIFTSEMESKAKEKRIKSVISKINRILKLLGSESLPMEAGEFEHSDGSLLENLCAINHMQNALRSVKPSLVHSESSLSLFEKLAKQCPTNSFDKFHPDLQKYFEECLRRDYPQLKRIKKYYYGYSFDRGSLFAESEEIESDPMAKRIHSVMLNYMLQVADNLGCGHIDDVSLIRYSFIYDHRSNAGTQSGLLFQMDWELKTYYSKDKETADAVLAYISKAVKMDLVADQRIRRKIISGICCLKYKNEIRMPRRIDVILVPANNQPHGFAIECNI